MTTADNTDPRPGPPMFRFLLAASALAATPAARADGTLDRLHRLVSPEFRRLDDRRAELLAGPVFRPPPARCPRLGFHSTAARAPNSPRWVRVDLGESRPVDTVVVVPAAAPPGHDGAGYFFPLRFRVELSDTPDFAAPVVVADHTDADYPAPGERPVLVPAGGRDARYVRFTATRQAGGRNGLYFVALGELLVLSGTMNAAAGRPVEASDSLENLPAWGRQNLVDGQGLLGPPIGPRPSPRNGFHAAVSRTPDAEKWVQIDLGSDHPLDEVRLVPARPSDFADRPGFGFPLRFRVEAAATPDFESPVTLSDTGGGDFPSPGDGVVVVPGGGARGRYVRVTATRLWERTRDFVFALAELQVYSRGKNVARGAAVSASDTIDGGLWGRPFLVDGFASQNELLEWPEWVEQEARAAAGEAELREVEAAWGLAREAADRVVVRSAAGLAGGGLAAVVGLAWRGRVLRRREAERLRERIARDLHDEVGSNLGGILLLAQSSDRADPDAAGRDLTEIARIARTTAEALRDLVWLLGPEPTTADELIARIRETAAVLFSGVAYTVDIPDGAIPPRPGLEFRRQVYLAFKEMAHNAARHSGAKAVAVRCRRDGRRFVLEVQDDGRGFDPAGVTGGTGLRGLRARAAALGGELQAESSPGCGAVVRLVVPV